MREGDAPADSLLIAAELSHSPRRFAPGGMRQLISRIVPKKARSKDMLSKIPLNLEKIKKEDIDKEILRAGIIA